MPVIPQLFLPSGYFLAVTSGVDVDSGDVAVESDVLWIAELEEHMSDFS